MAWLAVDKNGDEWIYDSEPMKCSSSFETGGMCNNAIELPIGYIKKIIGKKLTFENSPIELK